MRTKLFLTALALVAMTTIVGAQTKSAVQNQQKTSGKCLTYVDANNNGICDNYEMRTDNTAAAGNNNGNCRCFAKGNNKGMGMGNGQGKMMSGNRGRGAGKCIATGKGKSGNFVDADNNGVCDLYESSVKK